MKRKAYVKQLNKLKNQSNASDKQEVKKETEINATASYVVPSSSTGHKKLPDKVPLPKVDVLMKRKRPISPKSESVTPSNSCEKMEEGQEPFYLTRSTLKWQYASEAHEPTLSDKTLSSSPSTESEETNPYPETTLIDMDKINKPEHASSDGKAISSREQIQHSAVSLVTLPGPVAEIQPRHTDSYSYENHPHTATGRHLEPLPPVVLPGRQPSMSMDSANVGGVNGMDYNMYHNHIPTSAWEQENNRYTEYHAWRDPNYYHDQIIVKNGNCNGANNNDSSLPNHNNRHVSVPSIVSDEYMSSNDVPSTKPSSGRRRRKRVQTPVQRSAANMRERRRMCHLNVAFDHLKEYLPNVKDKKKLSRIQTLKAAIYYIHLLQDSLKL